MFEVVLWFVCKLTILTASARIRRKLSVQICLKWQISAAVHFDDLFAVSLSGDFFPHLYKFEVSVAQ